MQVQPVREQQGVHLVEVDEEQAGQRLDNFLLARLKGVPRSRIYRIVRSGEVRVNSSRARPDQRLQAGDKVLFNPKQAIPVDFEGDNRLFVIPVEDVVAVFRADA